MKIFFYSLDIGMQFYGIALMYWLMSWHYYCASMYIPRSLERSNSETSPSYSNINDNSTTESEEITEDSGKRNVFLRKLGHACCLGLGVLLAVSFFGAQVERRDKI